MTWLFKTPRHKQQFKPISLFRKAKHDDLEFILKGGIHIAVLQLSADRFESEVVQCDKPVLVDFYADWCGPCKMVAPIVEEIAGESDRYKVCKLNVDDAPMIAARYNVISIPTLIVFKEGKVYQQVVGVKTKSAILAMLQ